MPRPRPGHWRSTRSNVANIASLPVGTCSMPAMNRCRSSHCLRRAHPRQVRQRPHGTVKASPWRRHPSLNGLEHAQEVCLQLFVMPRPLRGEAFKETVRLAVIRQECSAHAFRRRFVRGEPGACAKSKSGALGGLARLGSVVAPLRCAPPSPRRAARRGRPKAGRGGSWRLAACQGPQMRPLAAPPDGDRRQFAALGGS